MFSKIGIGKVVAFRDTMPIRLRRRLNPKSAPGKSQPERPTKAFACFSGACRVTRVKVSMAPKRNRGRRSGSGRADNFIRRRPGRARTGAMTGKIDWGRSGAFAALAHPASFFGW
jgi:hypothetical protein